MKAAIKCRTSERWVEELPLVFLGMRTAYKDDIKATSAELVYGQPLRLPGEFFGEEEKKNNPSSDFVQHLSETMSRLKTTTSFAPQKYKSFRIQSVSALYTRICAHRCSQETALAALRRTVRGGEKKRENDRFENQWKGKNDRYELSQASIRNGRSGTRR